MVVQLFVTLALIASYLGQIVIVCLLLRLPLAWILRFEWHFCATALACKGITGMSKMFNFFSLDKFFVVKMMGSDQARGFRG